jgi:HlyD family secretion protein
MSWTKRIIAALFVLAVTGMVVASLLPRKEPAVAVQTSAVKRGSITRKVSAAGKLQPATQVKVSSNVSGDLLELHVKEGDRVTKGQLLARIDSRRHLAQVRQQAAGRASAAAELSHQRVQVERLRQERDRVKRLLDSQSASEAEMERAQADVAAAEAQMESVRERVAQASAALAEAKEVLGFTTIYAPIDGVVTSRQKMVGERVRGSDLNEDVLLVISTLSSMEMKAEVGEHEVVFLHLGDQAEVEIDAFPDKRWPAQVIEIAQNANVRNPGTEQEVTSFPVRLALTSPVPGALPGMSAQVGISSETHDDALIVPIQAVTVRSERELSADGGAGASARVEGQIGQVVGGKKKPVREPMQKVIFVVEGNVAKVRRVETGLSSESEIEILNGLKEGEVVVEGPYRTLSRELRDNRPIKVEEPGRPGKPSTAASAPAAEARG